MPQWKAPSTNVLLTFALQHPVARDMVEKWTREARKRGCPVEEIPLGKRYATGCLGQVTCARRGFSDAELRDMRAAFHRRQGHKLSEAKRKAREHAARPQITTVFSRELSEAMRQGRRPTADAPSATLSPSECSDSRIVPRFSYFTFACVPRAAEAGAAAILGRDLARRHFRHGCVCLFLGRSITVSFRRGSKREGPAPRAPRLRLHLREGDLFVIDAAAPHPLRYALTFDLPRSPPPLVAEAATRRVLKVRAPWPQLLLEGTKCWELRSRSTPFRGEFFVSECGTRFIQGTLRLQDCFELPRRFWKQTYACHRVRNAEEHPYLRKAPRIFAWLCTDAVRFSKALPLRRKHVGVTWTRLRRDPRRARKHTRRLALRCNASNARSDTRKAAFAPRLEETRWRGPGREDVVTPSSNRESGAPRTKRWRQGTLRRAADVTRAEGAAP